MVEIKKDFILTLIVTFLCQNVAFCFPETESTLRPPSQFSGTTAEFIEKQNQISHHLRQGDWIAYVGQMDYKELQGLKNRLMIAASFSTSNYLITLGSHIGGFEGKNILDVGCGVGAGPYYAWLKGAGFVVAVDRELAAVRVAQEVTGYLTDGEIRQAIMSAESIASVELFVRLLELKADEIPASQPPENIEIIQADATALGFQEDLFDIVNLTDVLHQMPKESQLLALKEAIRVVRSGGVIHVRVVNIDLLKKVVRIFKEEKGIIVKYEEPHPTIGGTEIIRIIGKESVTSTSIRHRLSRGSGHCL